MTEDHSDDLACCRLEIDRLDDLLVGLLAERFKVVERVIAHKQREGLPADIPDRVEQVLLRVEDFAAVSGLPEGAAKRIWRVVIAETIAFERARNVSG